MVVVRCRPEAGRVEFNIADLFECVADAVPEREAVVCGAERRSYAELDERATRLAHALRAAGVQPGDHVGCYLRNSVAHLEVMLACYKARAVPIPGFPGTGNFYGKGADVDATMEIQGTGYGATSSNPSGGIPPLSVHLDHAFSTGHWGGAG